MALLYFSDILKKANLDPKKVVLIRHSLTDKHFRECYEADKVYEYTCHQKPGFRKGYTHWAVFISGAGTYAKFHAIYEVGGSRPDNEVLIPEGLQKIEAASYNGQYEIYDLKRLDVLKDMEKSLLLTGGNRQEAGIRQQQMKRRSFLSLWMRRRSFLDLRTLS